MSKFELAIPFDYRKFEQQTKTEEVLVIPDGRIIANVKVRDFLVKRYWFSNVDFELIEEGVLNDVDKFGLGWSIRKMMDVPMNLEEGFISSAIVGEDKAWEWELAGRVKTIERIPNVLDCSFRLGFPVWREMPNSQSELKQILGDGRIATSYPETLLWVH